MNKVKLITDSCSSLTKKELKLMGVDYVGLTIMVDDMYCNAYDCPITDPEEFYTTIKSAKKVSTGCGNVQTFVDIFEKWAHLGYDCVYIGLSSGLSSTYANAVKASEQVNKTCGKHIWVADSLTGSFGIAQSLDRAVKMVAQNKSAQEIFNAIDKNAVRTAVYFIPSDLQFLARSGRLNKIVATVGTAIQLVPTLCANEEGKLKLSGKAIGRKKAIKNLQNTLLNTMDTQSEEKIYIGHTGQTEEAEALAEWLKQNTSNKTIQIGYIDYTMGCCCGPQTLAVFVTRK